MEQGFTRQTFLLRGAGGLLAVPTLGALLAACGGAETSGNGSAAPPKTPTGTLRVALPAFPVSLDPTVDGAVSTIAVLYNVYESMVGFNSDYTKLEGVLATKFESSPDAREWTFTMREGVKFHDGAELDSTAAKLSIEYALREGSAFGAALLGEPTLDDSDPAVLKVTYKDPYPDLARNLTYAGPVFSPKLLAGGVKASEKAVAKTQSGSGPYKVTSVRDGQGIDAEAFDGYWGSKGHVAAVKYSVIPDEAGRNSALAAGDVDLVMQMAPLPARSMKSNKQVTVQSRPTWTTVLLQPVNTLPPFDDVRVRQALIHALDRDSLVKNLLLGEAKTDDSMFPQGIYGYAEPATTYPFDPDKAKALLQEAGYDGAPVRMSTRSDAVLASEISQALVGQLKDVGFSVTSEVLDPAAFEADKYVEKPKYQLHWNEWGWVTGGPFHLTLGAMATVSKYSNPKYDALVAKVNTTPDGAEREKYIAEAIEQWAQDAPWATLWVPNRLDGSAAALNGYRTPPNVITLLGRAYLAGAES
jgi:peptide/nickel transport system substrate-binding protein